MENLMKHPMHSNVYYPEWISESETYFLPTYIPASEPPEVGTVMNKPLGTRATWWANFTATTITEKFGPGLSFVVGDWFNHRTTVLEKNNAYFDGARVYFKSKQDAMMFLLRWS